MGKESKIEWTDSTFNPWEGCTKVGPGCDNCYAEHRNARFAGGEAPNWGSGAPRRRTSEANWSKPVQWNATRFMECGECGWRGECVAEIIGCAGCGSIDQMNDSRRRVFCASLADWLDNEAPIEWLVDLLQLVYLTPNLDWLLLTKRIGNFTSLLERVDAHFSECGLIGLINTKCGIHPVVLHSHIRKWVRGAAPANVWIGATVVNQEEADRDIPKLLAVPAKVRFLSIEPMLSAIALQGLASGKTMEYDEYRQFLAAEGPKEYPHLDNKGKINWVIVGGESGPKARPMHPAWVRSLRDQCVDARVPFLFKQWGEWVDCDSGPDDDAAYENKATCWVNFDGTSCTGELGVDFFGQHPMYRIGKKAAGRVLDGRTWDQCPAHKTDTQLYGPLPEEK